MTIDIDSINYDQNGLVPAIVQDERTGDILMLAYMNEEALQKTVETKEAWFYSRKRKELWNKGATSGNRQIVKRLSMDCDQDTILLQVDPLGPACHSGKITCFHEIVYEETESARGVVHEVADEIKERRLNPVEGSYTSYLFQEGLDKVLKKIGEESTEVVIGAKNGDNDELKNELADLTYHTLVLMELMDVSVEDVKGILKERRLKNEAASPL